MPWPEVGKPRSKHGKTWKIIIAANTPGMVIIPITIFVGYALAQSGYAQTKVGMPWSK
jgi:hypothetical protein